MLSIDLLDVITSIIKKNEAETWKFNKNLEIKTYADENGLFGTREMLVIRKIEIMLLEKIKIIIKNSNRYKQLNWYGHV